MDYVQRAVYNFFFFAFHIQLLFLTNANGIARHGSAQLSIERHNMSSLNQHLYSTDHISILPFTRFLVQRLFSSVASTLLLCCIIQNLDSQLVSTWLSTWITIIIINNRIRSKQVGLFDYCRKLPSCIVFLHISNLRHEFVLFQFCAGVVHYLFFASFFAGAFIVLIGFPALAYQQ